VKLDHPENAALRDLSRRELAVMSVFALAIIWLGLAPRPVLQRNLPTGGVELQCPIGATPRLLGPLTRATVDIFLHAGLITKRHRYEDVIAQPPA
jgi:hypothetical protein